MPKNKPEPQQDEDKAPTKPTPDNDDYDLSSESSSSDDDSLVLEGVLVRNPDVSSSSDEDEVEDSEDEQEEEEEAKKPAAGSKNDNDKPQSAKRPAETAVTTKKKKPKNKKRSSHQPEIDVTHVDFIFCDMDPKYWDGLRSLLCNAGSALYQAHASSVADAVIEYDMVGTCLGQPDDPEHAVFGFNSLLHWAHFPEAAQQAFSAVCQHKPQPPADKASTAARTRLVTALQTETKSSKVAFLLSGRMVNLPVEIVLALHQQLWLDITWAQTQTTKQSYRDVPMVVRLAPCTRDDDDDDDESCEHDDQGGYAYRYFDDEYLAAQASASYVVQGPRSFSREDVLYLRVLVLDLQAYQRAIQAMERMANGGGASGGQVSSSGKHDGANKNAGSSGGVKKKKKKGKR